jgi:hypothetical protein
MVTRSPGRRDFAAEAIQCYRAQNWRSRELLIANATGTPFNFSDEDIVELMFPDYAKVHEMKNTLIATASGEWMVNWMDDCVYDKTFIQQHVATVKHDTVNVFLNNFAFDCSTKRYVEVPSHWYHSISFSRMAQSRYPETGNEADIISQFEKRHIVSNTPSAMVKIAKYVEKIDWNYTVPPHPPKYGGCTRP